MVDVDVSTPEGAENQGFGDKRGNGADQSRLYLAAKTLSGDLRDQLLELVRDLRQPFHKIGEKQQEKYVSRVSFMVDGLLERVVALVAAHDFPAIPALLKQATVKDAIEAKVELSRYDESRHLLMDAAGSKVLIVLADADQFHGARGPAKIDKDEPELPVEADKPQLALPAPREGGEAAP